jgi:hypothetical protein
MAAVERIISAEAAASGVEREPDVDWWLSMPVLSCDPDGTTQHSGGVHRALRR